MNEPFVSVVIATYNMGQYLAETMRSVLAQSYNNYEVIVIDDGSEDNTSEVMAEFIKDPRVHYLPQENRGQPKAKNAGLKACQGEFIAFCDADDLWHVDKLKKQLVCFDDPKVGVVYSEVSYIDENGQPLEKPQPYARYSGQITDKLIHKNFIPFGTAVIRHECIDKLGGFDEALPMGIDWDLWLRYSIEYEFQYIPDKTYIYRIWSGQMSSNYRGRYANAEKIMNKFLQQHPDVVARDLVSAAWADTYTNLAMAIAKGEGKIWQPFTYLLKSMRYDPGYWPTWKALIKLVIRKV